MHLSDPSILRQHNYLYTDDFENQRVPSASPSPSLLDSLPLSPPYTFQAYTDPHSTPEPPTFYHPSTDCYSDPGQSISPDNFPALLLDLCAMNRLRNPPNLVQEPPTDSSTSQLVSGSSPMLHYRPHDGIIPLDQRHGLKGTRIPAHRQEMAYLDQQVAFKRLSLGSSVGSTAPGTPYTQTSSCPPTVYQDSSSASSPHIESLDIASLSAGQVSKPVFPDPYIPMQDAFLAPAFEDYNPTGHGQAKLTTIEAAMGQAIAQERKPETGHQYSPESKESLNSLYDMDHDGTSRPFAESGTVGTKLDLNISEVYRDEYGSSTIIQAPASQGHYTAEQTNLHPSYHHTVFRERLRAANQGHLSTRSASPSIQVTQEQSPYLPTFDFAVEKFSNPASNPHSPATRLISASSMSEKQKANISARDYQLSNMQRDQAPSRTISPKEAILVYNEAEEDAKMPLFPQEKLQKRENQFASTNSNTRHLPDRSDVENSDTQRNYDNIQSRRRPNFSSSAPSSQSGPNYSLMSPSVSSASSNVPMPQQYPFISNPRRQSSSTQSPSDPPVFHPQLASMDSTRSENSQQETIRFTADTELPTPSPSSPPQRPTDTLAGSGSYACTSTGCSQRFDTSAKLHKHRREAHQPTSPLPNPSTPTASSRATTNTPGSSGSTTVNRNNQAGPHKCERTNPSTGKPCNTQFSRSYDLTRHEETIHSNRKMKVRCQFCTEEKTFSRNDALTRHMRVVHPDVDFPGKTKRRAG